MDPITGIGLAASVVQIVTFSIQTVETCRQVYKQGSAIEFESLNDTTGHLARLADGLQKSLQDSGTRSQALTREEKDLVDLGRKCQGCADNLQKELSQLHTQPRSSALGAVRKTFRTIWKRDSIEKIYKEMQGYQATLETSLLARLR